jgi:hypothetical protein
MNPGLLLILAANLGLAAALYAELQPATPDVTPREAAVPAIAAPAAAPAVPPRARWTTVALERPLFAPDRRPPREARVAGAGEALPRLAGTIRADATVLAIFAPAGDGKPQVIGPHGSIAGWTVEEIADDSVTLTRGASTTVLRLSYAGGPPAPPPVAKPTATVILHDKASNPFLQP